MPKRRLVALAASLVTTLLAANLILLPAPPSQAHPLGNFTINHYDRITVSDTGIEVFRVLDMAFQKQSLMLSSTPSIYPVHGLLGNGYGWRRDPFTGMRDFHQGLDLVAPIGTKVIAPADGIVIGRALYEGGLTVAEASASLRSSPTDSPS